MRAPFPLSPLSPLFLFLSPGRLVGLALLLPSLALAQNLPPHALGAADPAAPTAPIAYRGITPQPVNAQDFAPQDWRAAHAAVGAFPRGHADILAWEAAQAATGIPSQTLSAPPSVHGDPLPVQRPHPMHPQHQGEHKP